MLGLQGFREFGFRIEGLGFRVRVQRGLAVRGLGCIGCHWDFFQRRAFETKVGRHGFLC